MINNDKESQINILLITLSYVIVGLFLEIHLYSEYSTNIIFLISLFIFIYSFFNLKKSYLFFLFFLLVIPSSSRYLYQSSNFSSFGSVEIFGVAILNIFVAYYFIRFFLKRDNKSFFPPQKANFLLFYIIIFLIINSLNNWIFSDYELIAIRKDLIYLLVLGLSFFTVKYLVTKDKTRNYFFRYIIPIIVSYYIARPIIISFLPFLIDIKSVVFLSFDALEWTSFATLFLLVGKVRNTIKFKGGIIIYSLLFTLPIMIFLQPGGKLILFSFIIGFLILINYFFNFCNSRLFKTESIIKFFSFGLLVLIIMMLPYTQNFIKENLKTERFQDNLAKATDFFEFLRGEEELIGKSVKVRLLELENIFLKYKTEPVLFLLGSGIGGHFKYYKGSGLAQKLGPSAYTKDQRFTGKYYSPHSSLNYILLKFGLLGIIIWILLLFKIFKSLLFSNIDSRYFLLSILFLLFLFSFGWNNKVAFILGLLFAFWRYDYNEKTNILF